MPKAGHTQSKRDLIGQNKLRPRCFPAQVIQEIRDLIHKRGGNTAAAEAAVAAATAALDAPLPSGAWSQPTTENGVSAGSKASSSGSSKGSAKAEPGNSGAGGGGEGDAGSRDAAAAAASPEGAKSASGGDELGAGSSTTTTAADTNAIRDAPASSGTSSTSPRLGEGMYAGGVVRNSDGSIVSDGIMMPADGSVKAGAPDKGVGSGGRESGSGGGGANAGGGGKGGSAGERGEGGRVVCSRRRMAHEREELCTNMFAHMRVHVH